MGPVQGHLVKDFDELDASGPGAFFFLVEPIEGGERRTFVFNCPCGCGTNCAIPLTPWRTHPFWEWDGNVETPTLSPSIQRLDGCMWHGFLRNGVWETV